MQIAKIIEAPHLLYTGDNGHKTYGITVEGTEEKKTGYSHKWNINDSTLLNSDHRMVMMKLGLTDAEYVALIENIKQLQAS